MYLMKLFYKEEKFRPYFIISFTVSIALFLVLWNLLFFDIGVTRDKVYFTIFFLISITITIVFYILHRNGDFVFTTNKPTSIIHRAVGYGLTFCAFLATIVSFIPGIGEFKDKVYLSILFAITLIISFIYDNLARKYNALLVNLDSETKDLINSYHQLKEYEITESYNRAFSDFTRYTNYVCGVQVYNYHLLPKLNGGSIKIEYESGSMQEGVNINAIIQNYYDYKSETIRQLKRFILDARINKNIDEAGTLLNNISDEIKKSDFKDDALIAVWIIIVEEIIMYGININKKVTFDEFVDVFFKGQGLRLNKKIGLFKFILYSDILKLKSRDEFTYKNDNPLKENRQYVAVKAISDKGIKKILLVIVDTKDFDVESKEFLTDDIIDTLQGILNSNNLFKLTYTISDGKGEVHDNFSKITSEY